MSDQAGQEAPGSVHKRAPIYPHMDGDFIVIGPECFGYPDGSVLSWRGQNYTPQVPTLRVRLHNAWVRLRSRGDSDDG